MIRLLSLVLMITAIAFAPYSGYAQEFKTLSLNESINLGLENSNYLHSSRMRVQNSEARSREVRSSLFPSLKFNGLYTRLSEIPSYLIQMPFGGGSLPISQNIPNTYTLRLSMQQPLFTGSRLSGTSDLAKNQMLAQMEEYNKDEQELIFNIKNAYWNVYKTKKFKEVIDENVNQIKAHLQDVSNFAEQGLATNNDVLKVQVQLAEAQLRQIDGNNAVKLSKLALSNTIGIPLNTEIEISEEIKPKIEIIKDVEQFISKAFENRPELKAMDYRIKAGESGVTIAQSGWMPQVYLQGNYNYARPNQRVFPSTDKFKDTWDVSVSVSFDIWNWGQTGNQVSQAETQLEQAKDSYKMIRDNITLEVTQNYLNIIQAKEKMVVSENSVKQAEENYRITNEKFRNGLVLNSELLDAEVALLQARTNYLQSLVDYELAKARLEKSSGEVSTRN